jgi:hypothetical protein
MNLVFSYSVHEDKRLAEAGFTFLGAARDSKNVEVHVFQLLSLEEYQAEGGDKAVDVATAKAAPLVKHRILYLYKPQTGCPYVRS